MSRQLQMQNRLSISLLFSGYFDGIVENLSLLQEYYPGWVMRLYYDLDDDDFLSKVIFHCNQ